MANIKSQQKRILTNERRRLRNKSVKSSLHTAVRSEDFTALLRSRARSFVLMRFCCDLMLATRHFLLRIGVCSGCPNTQ